MTATVAEATPTAAAVTARPQPLLSEAARELLRGAVLDGTLLPGEVLSDADLIAWLGVSRTPIRAALDDLAEVGLVELSANRWTRVACPAPVEVALDVEIWSGLLGVLVSRVEWSPARVRLVRRLLLRAAGVVESLDGAPVRVADLTRLAALTLAPSRWSD